MRRRETEEKYQKVTWQLNDTHTKTWTTHTNTKDSDKSPRKSILKADWNQDKSQQPSLMWIVRASLTILAIKFTLSHQYTRTHKSKQIRHSPRMHDTNIHMYTQNTRAIQSGNRKESKNWKSQITHLRLCVGMEKQQQPKQQTEENEWKKKNIKRDECKCKEENGKTTTTTTHRNTHNIKFNIKLYINKMMDNGKEEAKKHGRKKNRKSRKYLRVNCLI